MSAETPGALVLATRLSRVAYRHATEDVIGMRLKQFAALAYLRQLPGVSQRQLGDAMLLDANNCVLLLNGIEDAGWAERRRDPDDRRRHVVQITDSGREALERAEQALDDLEDAVLDGLTAEERATLRELLAKALSGVPVQVSA
jgi:DNA-binding MarR family transcriptional regulator